MRISDWIQTCALPISFIVISQELQPPEVPMSAVPDEDPCPRAAAGPPSLEVAFLQSVFAELSGLRGRAPGDAADGTAAEDRAPGTDSPGPECCLAFTRPGPYLKARTRDGGGRSERA